MASSRYEKNQRYSDSQPIGQVLWTGFVAIVIALLALNHASDPGRSTTAAELENGAERLPGSLRTVSGASLRPVAASAADSLKSASR